MKCLTQIPKVVVLALTILCTLVLVSCSTQNKSSQSETVNLTAQQKADERKHILKNVDDTLLELYKHEPAAQKKIENAYGYAVFANTGYNIILYVGGKGRGVAFKNADKKPMFMTMLNAGTGPGVGYNEYRQILAFSTEFLFKQFITIGLNSSASANATVKIGDVDIDEAGVTNLIPGVSLYQINDEGIDIQANWGGMKYFKDNDLN